MNNIRRNTTEAVRRAVRKLNFPIDQVAVKTDHVETPAGPTRFVWATMVDVLNNEGKRLGDLLREAGFPVSGAEDYLVVIDEPTDALGAPPKYASLSV